MNLNTRFRVASVSKLLLAVTALRLQEQGRLTLDDPIGRYVPALPPGARRVTIHQLLTHTSGLPDPEQLGAAPIDAYRTPLSLDAYLKRYAAAPMLAQPGQKFHYNNFDFIVLSKVIEQAAGEPWAAAIQRRVLQPAQMADSGYVVDRPEPGDLARAQYRDASGRWQPDPPYLLATYFGAAALYSTAPDLARFDAALRRGALLSRASQAQLQRADPALGGVAPGAWVTTPTYGGRRVTLQERYGNLWGTYSLMARDVNQANLVIVLSNRHDQARPLEHQLEASLLGALYRP